MVVKETMVVKEMEVSELHKKLRKYFSMQDVNLLPDICSAFFMDLLIVSTIDLYTHKEAELYKKRVNENLYKVCNMIDKDEKEWLRISIVEDSDISDELIDKSVDRV